MYSENEVNQIKKLKNNYKKLIRASISVFTIKNNKYNEYITDYRNYYQDHKSIIIGDIKMAINENDLQINIESELTNISDEILHLKVDLHVFFRLYKMKNYKVEKLTNIKDLIELENQSEIWFRGQTNAEWQLIPSIFRNIKKSALWGWDEIYNEYNTKPKKVSLIKKLEEVDIDTITNPYRTISFIQHSIGYSQLIDFSKTSKIPLSFALSNSAQMASYYEDDACVYSLNVENYKILDNIDEIDSVVKGSKVQLFKRNELLVNLIRNRTWIDLMSGNKKSIIHLINKPTNDRMLFQKGRFILYDNVIIIDSDIYMSFSKIGFMEKQLTKFVIECNNKESLFEELMKEYPQYHQRYLFDPYLYLSESDK